MNPDQQRDELVDDLLDRWEDAFEAGNEIGVKALCADHPELVDTVRSKIAAIKKMNGCLDAHVDDSAFAETEADHGLVKPEPIGLSSVDVESRLLDLRFHDRGGLGVVYKAHDHELHRDVAVKFLHQKIARNEVDRLRFQQEAEITGRLDHPGVVPVYSMGKSDEQPFYVMRFIRGDTYDDAIKRFHANRDEWSPGEQRVAMRKLLVQLVSVCQTIGYAHTRGIVHRDIKPKNIMLGKHGETLVVDWGLAIPFERAGKFRVKEEKTLVPQTNQEDSNSGREGEGTPIYMSPEQAAGKEDLGPASDIYSLGIVLYRALTGEYAFRGDSPIHIRQEVIQGRYEPPRKLDNSIPAPLESICLKAMELEPKRRYQTATEMAEDLENYLAGAPVNAHEYSPFEKFTRLVRRHQALFTTLLTAASLLTLGSLYATTRMYTLHDQTRRSLVAAKESQVDSLNMTCRMTARSIQYNLEARLIALEELASSKTMIQLIQAADGPEKRTELHELLVANRAAIQARLPSVSWFLLDSKGKLLCRASDSDEQPLKKIWRWTRPYFHGGNLKLPSSEDPADIPPPSAQPVLSPAFFGSYQDRELVSLTVPVLGRQNSAIGVLVMTIQMGQFEPLIEEESSGSASSQRFAALVETRGELQGALLHHPGLQGSSSEDVRRMQVCDSVFQSVTQVDCNTIEPQTIENYIDPIEGKYSGEWKSVALPIQIRSRNNSKLQCGWYLLVQDRPLSID